MSILPPILTSAKMTAEWEEKLDQIERGELSATQFMYEIESFVRNVVDQEKSTVATFQFENNRPQKEEIGKCPKCQVQCMRVIKTFIVQIENVHLLYGKRNRFFESQGKKLTKTIAKSLLSKGEVLVKNLTSQKSGRLMTLLLKMELGEKYTNKLEFPKANV